MKILKSKQLWQILAIIGILAGAIVLLFMPNLIENRYPYSYERIEQEKGKVSALNSTLSSNESSIESTMSEIQRLEVEDKEAEKEMLEVEKQLNGIDFKLNVPSILISLEQAAVKNDVELLINYGSMTTTGNSNGGFVEDNIHEGFEEDFENPEEDFGRPEDERDEERDRERERREREREEREREMGEPGQPETFPEDEMLEDEFAGGDSFPVDEVDEASTEVGADISIKEEEVEGEPVEEEVEGEGEQENADVNGENPESEGETTTQKVEVPRIEGMNVTTIPLNIKGKFYNVRSYLRYLDEIGLIEPSSVNIKSDGENITASIIINVFHDDMEVN